MFLLAQGLVTGAFQLVTPLDDAFPVLLEATRMVPQHSLLHLGTGLLALAVLRRGSVRAAWVFALGFGAFYTALGVGGLAGGNPLGLGLQPFDHPFHLIAGVPGLVAAALGCRAVRPSGASMERT
ncbi:MAG: DUF4383 domain-containing protein [Egibacteraceae bacterium]